MELTAEQVLERIKAGKKLDGEELRGIVLARANLSGASMRRCDLDGANLEGALLAQCNMKGASLKEAYLVGADLREVNLDNADLEGANMERAILVGANLARANLEGVNLSGANLARAKLTHAQLDSANLGGADLSGASIANADLVEAYLGAAKLLSADLSGATLSGANLEEADLTDANLSNATMEKITAPNAKFLSANLTKADFKGSELEGCQFNGADLRNASLLSAGIARCVFHGAKVHGLVGTGNEPTAASADWVDASPNGDGTGRAVGAQAAAYLSGIAAEKPAETRYFGRGDVLKNATLEFGTGASVEIDSRFEECQIVLADETQLVVGPEGVLYGCRISGGGNITIFGHVHERQGPAIVGPKQVMVSKGGVLVGTVEQSQERTRFAFEPGARLRLRVSKSKKSS